MEAPSPHDGPALDAELLVLRPDGSVVQRVSLRDQPVTVGRLPEQNDVALAPDSELLVSRTAHSTFAPEEGRWVVIDGGSVNGTYVRRGGRLEQVEGRMALLDGDVVCILASVSSVGKRRYFELAFRSVAEPQATRAAPFTARVERESGSRAGCLAYDRHAARLVLVQDEASHEIRLRPQGHRLVAFMADRNTAAGGEPVLCSHEELMHAVWGDEPMHNRLELARLVWELRRELRPYAAEQLIESERRRGYRLRTCRA